MDSSAFEISINELECITALSGILKIQGIALEYKYYAIFLK